MQPATRLPTEASPDTEPLKRWLATQLGVFEPADLDALQAIFDFVNADRKHRFGTYPANVLARRVLHLYQQGYRDHHEIRRLLIADGSGL